jgi:hypothetical protein
MCASWLRECSRLAALTYLVSLRAQDILVGYFDTSLNAQLPGTGLCVCVVACPCPSHVMAYPFVLHQGF